MTERLLLNAFEDNHESLVIKAALILNSEEQAADVVQDVFIKLWEKRKSIVITTSIKSYLFRMVSNESISFLRQRAGKRKVELQDEINDYANEAEESNLETDELKTKIKSAVEMLPTRCKMIFIMSRYKNMSHKEIASMLDISYKTVENQMTKALKHLRLELKEYL